VQLHFVPVEKQPFLQLFTSQGKGAGQAGGRAHLRNSNLLRPIRVETYVCCLGADGSIGFNRQISTRRSLSCWAVLI